MWLIYNNLCEMSEACINKCCQAYDITRFSLIPGLWQEIHPGFDPDVSIEVISLRKESPEVS